LSTWLVPLKDAAGEVTSVLGVSRDISNLKQSEEELRQARDFLEERVAERTAELSDSQEKMRSLTAQTVKTQEEERRTISRELHDDAGQALITLQYSLAAVQNELPETETFSRKRLSDSLRVIDQTMQHIRSLAHSLRPPVLDIGGIDLSLQEYCREQTERTRIPILYQGQDIPGLPDEISISLYRFVQEGLTNVLKHAQATQAKVRLQYKKGEISISVSDNGIGMDDPIPPRGMGLDGIRERLKLLGGRLETHSTKGRGTRLVAYVPWARSGPPLT
jgi:signal transduction histidine kinase